MPLFSTPLFTALMPLPQAAAASVAAITVAVSLAVGLPALAPPTPAAQPVDSTLPAPSEPEPAAGEPVQYRAPVRAPIVDSFRAPTTFAGRGNRGLEYSATSGQVVIASAGGVVTFAGVIAGENFVTIQHGDGLRTSYSYLADVTVAQGQSIVAGEAIGASGSRLHFGVRVGDTYLDPAILLASSDGAREHARLIPVDS